MKKTIILCLMLIPMLLFSLYERVYCEAGDASKPLAASASSKYKVYILAGQSNMAGVGMNHELPQEYLGVQENVKIYAEGTVDASKRCTWSSLSPGFGSASGCFGPELSFGKVMTSANPEDKILLIKCGWSGTNLQNDWRPPSAGGTTGVLYKNLVETVNNALAELDPGIDYELSGMCWMQGESDACSIYPAREYEDTLTAFINDVRKEFNAPALPFIIAMIDDSDVWAEHAIVRQAEINVSRNVPNVGIFDTKDYDTDGTHYRTQGILDMGVDFAKAFLTTTKVVSGDVNGDGKFNSLDFGALRMYLLGMINDMEYSEWKTAADLNGDNKINSIDFALMRSRLLGGTYGT